MPANDDFVEYDGVNLFTKTLTGSVKKKLLKSEEVKIGAPKRIRPIIEKNNNHKTEVVPILKEKDVIGVMTKCACGEIIKIYFKYE